MRALQALGCGGPASPLLLELAKEAFINAAQDQRQASAQADRPPRRRHPEPLE